MASNFVFEEDSKIGIKLEEPSLPPQLLDHTYAASSFNECFGDAYKGTESNDHLRRIKSRCFIMISCLITVEPEFDDDIISGDSPYFPAEYFSKGASPAPSSSSSRPRESRDEKKARENGLPFTCEEIIDTPMDRFNDLLAAHPLTDEQISLCRDIRRRGKNKVCALFII